MWVYRCAYVAPKQTHNLSYTHHQACNLLKCAEKDFVWGRPLFVFLWEFIEYMRELMHVHETDFECALEAPEWGKWGKMWFLG